MLAPSSYPSSEPLRVVIVGAGIGGLTAALAFLRLGAHVRVFERAPAIREVGAGLGVWANAVRVLDSLGVGERLRASAQPVSKVGIYNARGVVLSESNLTELSQEIGAPSFVMHRADLQGALLDALPAGVLTTGVECVTCRESDEGVTVRFRQHAPVEADLVIGADGFRSAVRHHLWGDEPVRYSGQVCYRGVVPMTVKRPGLLAEIQGTGIRMGHCPFSANRMYWWACVNAAQGSSETAFESKRLLMERFADFPFELGQAIAATPAETILRSELSDRVPLKRWSRGPITLLGDAAHPMLPNLGQGACTAIEDAAVLAQCVATSSDLAEALALYEAARIPRTTRLVELSWRFGALARWTNPLAVLARETLLKLTPDALMRRELLTQLDYDASVSGLPENENAETPATALC